LISFFIVASLRYSCTVSAYRLGTRDQIGEAVQMPYRTGGEAVLEALIAQGIEVLFVLPGVQNDAFFNALHDAGDRLRAIVTRHEQGAAYMAHGYAAATGRPAAYCVVPGPGFLNTTAALSTAYACSAPVLCLAGHVSIENFKKFYRDMHVHVFVVIHSFQISPTLHAIISNPLVIQDMP
jgi:glyoxylate carboligase